MSSALKVCPQCGTEYPANARFCEIDGTALRSATQGTDLIGAIVADRYHILKKLGEGGMGQVYLAEHVKMGRKSALKVMHPGMKADVDAISRFNREAANASRIAHPNVASVYDFGETPDGIIYLAMEFVDGPPLTKVIEQQGALPPKRAADIVRQTADALAVASTPVRRHADVLDPLSPAQRPVGPARAGPRSTTRSGSRVGSATLHELRQRPGRDLVEPADVHRLDLPRAEQLVHERATDPEAVGGLDDGEQELLVALDGQVDDLGVADDRRSRCGRSYEAELSSCGHG